MSGGRKSDEFEVGQSLLVFSVDHRDESVSMEDILEAYLQLIELLLVKEDLKVRDCDHVQFGELRSNFNQVKSEEPLTNRELIDLFNM